METKTIQLNNEQAKVINNYKEFGFRNRNELINYALELLRNEIIKKIELEKSAELYAEIYDKDEETKSLTESALTN